MAVDNGLVGLVELGQGAVEGLNRRGGGRPPTLQLLRRQQRLDGLGRVAQPVVHDPEALAVVGRKVPGAARSFLGQSVSSVTVFLQSWRR